MVIDLNNISLKPGSDMVNYPPHYTFSKDHEPIDVIRDWKLNFNRGSAVKYIARAGRKEVATEIQDLEKAVAYLNHEIKALRMVQEVTPNYGSLGLSNSAINLSESDKASLGGFGSWKGGVLLSGDAKAFAGSLSSYVKPLPTTDIDSPRSYAKVHAINEHDAHASCQCVESEEDTLL